MQKLKCRKNGFRNGTSKIRTLNFKNSTTNFVVLQAAKSSFFTISSISKIRTLNFENLNVIFFLFKQ